MQKIKVLPTLPSLLVQPHVPLIHRDLSWLQFNEQVLAEARLESNPLLERCKFLAITATNLDEFFMIRVSSLGRPNPAYETKGTDRGGGIRERMERTRETILESVAEFTAKQTETFDQLVAQLASVKINVIRGAKPGELAHELGKQIFVEQVLPKLPMPERYGAARVASLENLQMLAILPGNRCTVVPRNIPLGLYKELESGERYFFFLDDLILTHLAGVLASSNPAVPASYEGTSILRLTRDGDIQVDLDDEEDPESIPDRVREGLGRRDKGRAIRLQYLGDVEPSALDPVGKALRLSGSNIYPAPRTCVLHGFWLLFRSIAPSISSPSPPRALKFPPLKPVISPAFEHPLIDDIFNYLKKRDFLLHHPYDSFDAYVAWIKAACADPAVKMIQQTIYRTDAQSDVIEALKGAAKTKKVRVVIELRARFDELNNLQLAESLREAGIEVCLGAGQQKIHAKLALVTRVEDGKDCLYTHLSTGNYHAANARQYTDLAILTSHPEIGADAQKFFDAVAKEEIPRGFKQLVLAPTRLHRRLISHIHTEVLHARAKRPARIFAKVNALVDPVMVHELYLASQAGVQIDLLVRGACSLVPGVKGLSDNIRVISIVDRFLEHSRIYYFSGQRKLYLSSADWMQRNFFTRLELAFPIREPHIFNYIEQTVIPTYLSDYEKSRELTPQGIWRRRVSTPEQSATIVRAQAVFEALAERNYIGTSLES